ncbi:MAG: AAA domain-containing protein [Sphingomonas fennica]
MIERDRLQALIAYVEATERDRLRVVTDMADYGGFRRAGEDVVRLPGVAVNRREGGDTVWLRVERLARDAPPAPADPALKAWIDLADDPARPPSLVAELPAERLEPALRAMAEPRLRLADHPARPALEAALDVYRRELWLPWSIAERPRRQAIDLYNGLFAVRQTLAGGAEQPVELVWGIGIARWRRGPGLVHPLLTVPLEIAIDEASHAILLRPRSEAPAAIETAALDALEAPAIDDWRAMAEATLAGLGEEGLTPFAAESFAPILRRAVALFDADGCYLPDLGDRPAPPQGDALRIDGGWVLLERTRPATQLIEDLGRFKGALAAVSDAADLPAAVRALAQAPADIAAEADAPAYRGISTIPGVTTADGRGQDLFFPLPFNREQVEAVRRLASRPGVVVQGPPGTGKTHTIANIISHYLAEGKRVLVTSQKAPALKVLRDKLPAAVRPLAVSLLDSDRDGLKQFQESVDIIADRLHRIRPAEAARHIADLDRRIEALHRGLAAIDREVETIGRAAMTEAAIDGHTVDPATAARRLAAAGDLAGWLPDAIDAVPGHEPGFDEDAVATLRRARKAAGRHLAALDLPAPPDALPSAAEVAAVHRDLAEAAALGAALAPDEALAVPTAAAEALMQQAAALIAARAAAPQGAQWAAVRDRWLADDADTALSALAGLAAEVAALGAGAAHALVRPVELPDGAADDPAFRRAIAMLADGGQFGMFGSIFARGLMAQVAAVRLAARRPADAGEWQEVAGALAFRDAADRLRAAWNGAAPAAGVEPVPADPAVAADAMRRTLTAVVALRDLARDERALEQAARRALPGWRRPTIGDDAGTAALAALLDRHLRLARASAAEAGRAALASVAAAMPGPSGEAMRAAVADLGRAGAGPAARWQVALDEAAAVAALAPAFADIRAVTAAIAASGAPLWAERLRQEPVVGGEDALTPGDWRERWTCRRLATWLARIDGHDRLRALGRQRREHEDQLRRTYEEAIEARTWCRLAEKASDQVRAALAAYAQAMRRLGRGTGVRAGRYRADARIAANRAKNALPCWIMPHYRVSESLPAELGLFDLVVVDEASQSTLAALPALLRAQRVLIVGDDRQVSPDAGFREEARMVQLADRHLGGQVADYHAALREEKSLYDLGAVVFAGGAIMLREHFRCVAPIIEYSKAQFYSHQLVPLRLPAASERLDPPLVDILVEDGYRRGKVNPPEVDCIVDAIGRIADDPAMAGRSIGVTTLLGHEQAAALVTAIEAVLGPEVMLAHDIRVGEPAAFQGDERDIMFVSLVADRGSSPLSGLAYEQRFNVAASRARDRMVLVRSVEPEELRPTDRLRRSLIDHMRAPFAGEGALVAERRASCESPFEEAMYDLLTGHGYRVETQVPVGGWRIDMVVEGADDRRLAIECDGDRYHGPDRWPEDMARQRVLERAGWTIWRCFASRFVRERAAVEAELLALLAERGIHPETGEALPPSRHTEHRRWRSTPLDPTPVPHAWFVVAPE